MKGKKIFKGCLVSTVIIVLLIGILFVLLNWRINKKREQANVEQKERTIKCNKTQLITEEVKIYFTEFHISEIDTLHFELIRNKKKIEETILTKEDFDYVSHKGYHSNCHIPFKKQNRSDIVVLRTKSGQKYYISGFRYYAYMHFGMFGYLGTSDCRILEKFTINNTKDINIINKFAGWTPSTKSKKQFIPTVTSLYDSLSNSLPINEKKAYKIIAEHSKNTTYLHNTMVGIEQNKDSTFYLIKQKTNDSTFHYTTIDVKTGKLKPYIKIN